MFLETATIETLKSQSSFQQKRKPLLKITDRDLDILGFLLDMKFAGHEEIYEKFFPPASRLLWGYSHWSRDRIAQLRKEGLVEPFQFPGSQKRYYLATEKGRRTLIRERPLCAPPWALKKPQYIHFEHDLMVLRVRLLLEFLVESVEGLSAVKNGHDLDRLYEEYLLRGNPQSFLKAEFASPGRTSNSVITGFTKAIVYTAILSAALRGGEVDLYFMKAKLNGLIPEQAANHIAEAFSDLTVKLITDWISKESNGVKDHLELQKPGNSVVIREMEKK